MYKHYSIIDDHIHYALPISYEQLQEAMERMGADKGVLVTVPDRNRVLVTPEALMIKARNEERFYVFTSLDVSEYFRHPKNLGKHFVKQIKRAVAMGCDGVKIIEGKPGMRKTLPIPDFDAPCWEPFWDYMEAQQLPILWHVNDPEEFWDIDSIPSWAKERGWFYDESYINNEEQYRQVLAVLQRHPKLKITFAHFFFLSAQLDRLQGILDAYPNVAVDLTPGIEMYMNFSKAPEKARAFFMKNAKRILYGTDLGARVILGSGESINMEENTHRSRLVQTFLSEEGKTLVKADGNFLVGTEDFQLNALHLPEPVLTDIFYQNFIDRVGQPRSIHKRAILRECKRIKMTVRVMSLIDPSIKKDFCYLEQVVSFFRNRG